MKLQDLLKFTTTILFEQTTRKYEDTYFIIPWIVCKDGFKISIQIHNGNYCESENGYRKLGNEWKMVEWGFPNYPDKLLIDTAEDKNNLTKTVGSIDIDLMQTILDNHGGISFKKTVKGYDNHTN